jgi:hypothetical protein
VISKALQNECYCSNIDKCEGQTSGRNPLFLFSLDQSQTLYKDKDMIHAELKSILKEYRELGYTLEIKLNASTLALQTELDRIQANPQACELPVIEIPAIHEIPVTINIPAIAIQEIQSVQEIQPV